MKKSISLIMIVCLSSVLMFSNISKAANLLNIQINSPSYTNMLYIDHVENGSPSGNTYKVIYKNIIPVSFTLQEGSSDYYIYGYFSSSFRVDILGIPGSTGNYSFNISYENSISDYDSIYSVQTSLDNNSSSRKTLNAFTFINNLNRYGDRINTGNIVITCAAEFLNNVSNIYPDSMDCYITTTVFSNAVYGDTTPRQIGMPGIISSAINSSTDIDTIISLLTSIRNYNIDIFNELNIDIENLLTQILAKDIVIADKVTLLEQYMSLFPQYSRDVVYYLQEFYGYLSEAESGATEAADAADQAASQAAAIAAVPRPNAGAIINEGVNRIDTDISSGFSVLGAILNQQWYIWILMIVISLAFVSYLMYGKGV